MNVSKLLSVAVVSGLLAGSVALAENHEDASKAAPTSKDNSFVPKEKNECKGHEKNKCKGHKDKKKPSKKAGNGCNSKDGCHAVDKSTETKVEAKPADAAPAAH